MSEHPLLTRRRFVTAVLGAGFGGASLKLWSDRTPFPESCFIRTHRVAGPADCAGKTAVFVTDIHYGHYFGPAEAAALNSLVQRQRPDIVFLGGDLADSPETDLSEFFSRWAPGCPTFFAPGNHDLGKRGSTASGVTRQAGDSGMTVLCNTTETWRGLEVIGLPSALKARQNLSLLRRPGLKVVLSHEPDTWDWSHARDVLQLAGHTHGGQVRFFGGPVCLPTLGRRYQMGRFDAPGNRTLLVNSGVGCTGVPSRINCPPEIWRLEFI